VAVEDENSGDPAKGSFIFSLGANPARLDLVKPEQALSCASGSDGFGEGCYDLIVWSEGGGCCSLGLRCYAEKGQLQRGYAGLREKGQLTGHATESFQGRTSVGSSGVSAFFCFSGRRARPLAAVLAIPGESHGGSKRGCGPSGRWGGTGAQAVNAKDNSRTSDANFA
jgi:hypothetical protein